MNGVVAHYKLAGKMLHKGGMYSRSRPLYSRPRDGGGNGNVDIYILCEDGIQTFCYNTTRHRAWRAYRLYGQNKLNGISTDIFENYINNGYMTRYKGLLGNYSDTEEKRINKIAMSHADYLGNEVNSDVDHEARVSIRNN